MSNSTNYKTEWDLSKYYYNSPEDPQIAIDFASVSQMVDDFVAKYKTKIADLSPAQLVEFFEFDAQISEKLHKVLLYFMYLTSLDSQNQDLLKKQAEYERKTVDLGNLLLFINEEFKLLGVEKTLELSQTLELKPYANYLVQKANNLKYLLDEKTEFALNLKETNGRSGFVKLFDEFTGDLKFEIELDGETKILTQEEIRTLRQDPKEEVRKKAFESISKTFLDKRAQMVYGNIYANIVKDCVSDVKLRGFDSVMSAQNVSEELPNEIVDTLMQVVSQNYPIYHKFLTIKNKILQKRGQQKESGKLKQYNLFAPITDKDYTFELDKALEIYFEAMGKFDSEFVEFGKDMFENGRVDVYPKFGKRGGAYAQYVKNHPSFVLLNYTKKLRDVSTIAHELGHAIHGNFSQKQPEQVYSTGLSLAETASVFAETLFANELEKEINDNEEQLVFLDERLGDIFATIFRQIMYINFEKETHDTFLAGKELGYLDFNQTWRSKQADLYGQNIEFTQEPEKDFGWSSIPHIFHSPFYCYSYAFGNLLSLALYQQYLNEGASFVPKYKEILASGGSKTPYDLLIQYGIDITKPEFFQSGLDYVATLVDQYEQLANNI